MLITLVKYVVDKQIAQSIILGVDVIYVDRNNGGDIMKNSEKFYGLAYKLLKYFVWLNIFVGVYVLGCIIGLVLRYKFFQVVYMDNFKYIIVVAFILGCTIGLKE